MSIITPSGLPTELTEITNGETMIEVYNPDTGQNEKCKADTVSTYVHLTDSGITISEAIKASIEYGKQVGELYYLDSYKTPQAYSDLSPSNYFPAICLDAIDVSEDIAAANWPELVPHLRAKALTFNEGITGEKSAFDVESWSISSNIGILTFADIAGENAILAALADDNLVHGGYGGWRSITLDSAIGSIAPGEYAISNVDVSLRQIRFNYTASNNSGSGTFTAKFYTNRVPGSSTTARLYQATGRTLVSASDEGDINGLRRRDAMQRITGSIESQAYLSTVGSGALSRGATRSSGVSGVAGIYSFIEFDSSNSVSPSTAKTDDEKTRVNQTAGHLYIHGRSYSA